MNNNYTKLAKYGLVGISMALIGLLAFQMKQYNETIRNHISESTEVMRASMRVEQELIDVSRETKEMMKETKEMMKELKEWLWLRNGK